MNVRRHEYEDFKCQRCGKTLERWQVALNSLSEHGRAARDGDQANWKHIMQCKECRKDGDGNL